MNFNELAKRTNLKPAFIRKCLREMKEILEPHIERGTNNSLMFNNSAVTILDSISQLKNEGLNLTAIKKKLFSEYGQTSGQEKDEPGQTLANQNDDGVVKGLTDKEKTVFALMDKVNEAKGKQKEAELELEKVVFNLKTLRLLPDSGNTDELYKRFNELNQRLSQIQVLVGILEDRTRPWIIGHGGNQKYWDDLKKLVQECLKS